MSERGTRGNRTLVGKPCMNRPLGRHGYKCEDNIKANLKDRNRVFMDSSILQQEPFAGCCRYASVKGVESIDQPTGLTALSSGFCTTKLAGPNGVLKYRIVEFRVSKFSNICGYRYLTTLIKRSGRHSGTI